MQIQKNDSKVNEFIKLLSEFKTQADKIARYAAEAYAEDPDFIDKVVEIDDSIPYQLVYNLVIAGQNRMVASLVWEMDKPGVRSLMKLPYEMQLIYAEKPIQVVVDGGQTLNIDVRNLTASQAKQVINGHHVRSLAEQRAYLEDRKIRKWSPPAKAEKDYECIKGSLVIHNPCTMTRRELAEVLAKMQ